MRDGDGEHLALPFEVMEDLVGGLFGRSLVDDAVEVKGSESLLEEGELGFVRFGEQDV